MPRLTDRTDRTDGTENARKTWNSLRIAEYTDLALTYRFPLFSVSIRNYPYKKFAGNCRAVTGGQNSNTDLYG